MSGRLASERLVGMNQNQWSACVGICTQVTNRLHAFGIATAYLLSVGDREFEPVSVLTREEWRDLNARPPIAYGRSFDNDWIVRLRRKEDRRIESSTVVSVNRVTGTVTYHGSLNNEG
jgi:hypothetical protein